MPRAKNGSVEIEYEVTGRTGDPVILLVMGLAGQLTVWPVTFVRGLAARGFRVASYDNRDVGLSSDFGHVGAYDVAQALQRAMRGEQVEAPYTLLDMAEDGLAVLDALGASRAHLIGASMGGMIAQIIAARHPDRTLTLTSIMSTSGRPGLPAGKPEAVQALLARPPATASREEIIRYGISVRRTIGSPGYPVDDAALRAIVERNVDRRYYPEGVGRQYGAILASGDRVELLRTVRVPSLVIHGAEDPLIPPDHGRDVAALIPDSLLEIYPGMGHDLAPGVVPLLVERIARHCAGGPA
jgi:pimeloyl-ACP methyl ester carboxylesterase